MLSMISFHYLKNLIVLKKPYMHNQCHEEDRSDPTNLIERFKTLGIGHFHATIPGAPGVKDGIADVVHEAEVDNLHSSLCACYKMPNICSSVSRLDFTSSPSSLDG